MTGVVTRIYPIQGEAVEPGQPLFEVRLTHEDLLQVQTEFLRTVEELDVIGREVARLEKVSKRGPRLTSSRPTATISTDARCASSTATRIGSSWPTTGL